MVECSKKSTCKNYGKECGSCTAMSDLYNHYPCYENKDLVEVRHAKWVEYELDERYGSDDSKTWYKCSDCQKGAHGWIDEDPWYSLPIKSDYCPHCGAKMDLEDQDKFEPKPPPYMLMYMGLEDAIDTTE